MERYIGSWTGRLNIIKMSILPKLFYRFNKISSKIPAGIFLELNKLILKYLQRIPNAKTIMKKKNKFGGVLLILRCIKKLS